MSVTTYTAHSCPKLSIPQPSCMSSAPSSPIGVEAKITISAKKPNKMSTVSVESNESSDPLESDYSEEDEEDLGNDSVSEEEEVQSSQKNKSDSDDESEDNEDDSDEDNNIDDAVKGDRQFSLDDFQILKTVGKSFLFLLYIAMFSTIL